MSGQRSPGIAGCIGWLLWTPIAQMASSWVYLKIWGWFAVPLGLPALTMAKAFGVLLLVSFCIPKRYDPNPDLVKEASFHLGYLMVALAVGWAWHFAV
jgi:hypothetical protein